MIALNKRFLANIRPVSAFPMIFISLIFIINNAWFPSLLFGFDRFYAVAAYCLLSFIFLINSRVFISLGSVVRDYFYVKDLNTLIPKLLIDDVNNEIFNIGKGEGHSINDLIKVIAQITGRNPEIIYFKSRRVDVPINYLSVEKMLRVTHWKALTTLHKGIQETWNWIHNNG